MGRKLKKGLDYFALDTSLNDKIRLLEAEFGLQAFAIVIKLYQKIYGQLGYYCDWNKDVALLFLSELGCHKGIDVPYLNKVVHRCVERDIFSEDMFRSFGILTSKRIQEHYFSAVARREHIEVENEYLLVKVSQFSENVDKNSISVSRNKQNVDRNTQSKEEKSREEYIYYHSFEMMMTEQLIASLKESMPGAKVPTTESQKVKWMNEFEKMKRIDKRSERDIKEVLSYATTNSFWKANIRSPKKLREKFETLYLQMHRTSSPDIQKNKFLNFQQRKYDMDELEAQLLKQN